VGFDSFDQKQRTPLPRWLWPPEIRHFPVGRRQVVGPPRAVHAWTVNLKEESFLKKSLIAACSALAGVALLTACSTGVEKPSEGGAKSAMDLKGTVTFLLPNTTTVRFTEHDAPAFIAAMKELAPGIKVDVQDANNDQSRQLTQAETAISQGTLGIVIAAADPSLSGAVLQKAADSNLPVVGYEHEALNGKVANQVMFDPVKVGEAQGTYFAAHLPTAKSGVVTIARIYGNKGDNYTTGVKKGQDEALDPLISSGKVKVACEDNATNWDPVNAQRLVEQCLTKTSNQIDAVIASNDGTAQGAIAAVEGQKLATAVYGGQDANLSALQFILQGKQKDTVFKDYSKEGKAAAELMVAALTNQQPPAGLVNGTFDNKALQVPAAYLDVKSIDAANIQTVVDAKLYTKDQICKGLTGVAFCQ
jgi:D-xylose transport system substrate-binding protein